MMADRINPYDLNHVARVRAKLIYLWPYRLERGLATRLLRRSSHQRRVNDGNP